VAKKKTARTMPKFHAPPADLVTRFQDATHKLKDAEHRKMFGFPAVFVHGNMFASLFNDSLILRLSPAEREALATIGGSPFEPMPGRPMREYLAVPDKIIMSPEELTGWLIKARAYAAGLTSQAKTPSRKTPAKRKSATAGGRKTSRTR
jgi:TfoX/Sxy family transcriptional regulator of competence genes